MNDAGDVPILEYHNIGPGRTAYDRSPAAFRADLARLYAERYRPVSLGEFLDGTIDLPAGMRPVVLTFDDARESQFRYLPDGRVDPACAIGILQGFHANHPDFAVKAVFFILPRDAFGQPSSAARKLQALVSMGCELGNHTVTHRSLRSLSDAEVQEEIAGCAAAIRKMAPAARVDTIALPMGIAPRNGALLAHGAANGLTYSNRAVLLVGAAPAPSPLTLRFNAMRIPRIQAREGPFGITYWLDRLARGRCRVCGGDPGVVAVPAGAVHALDPARLGSIRLRTYGKAPHA